MLILQPVERGIQRALLDLQRLFRHHLDVLCDRVAMNRPTRDYAKNQQVQGALRKLEFRWGWHACFFYIYSMTCRSARCQRGIFTPNVYLLL